MRPIQVSKVSSSTPAEIRVCLDCFASGDSAVAVLDVIELVELGSGAAAADLVGLDIVVPPPGAVELLSDASIFPSLTHPPSMSPRKIIQIVCLSITVPPVNGSTHSALSMRKKRDEDLITACTRLLLLSN